MKAPAHVEHFTVRSYEIDPSGRLRPVVLLRMLQETAWQHASALGKGYADRDGGDLFWVLSRLRMRVDALPQWGEELSIRTQPVGVQKLFALREFELVHSGDRSVGRVLSAWLLVDTKRGRPVRPEKLLSDIPLGEQEYRADLSALPAAGDSEAAGVTASSPVRAHDIDQYNHVNNAAYLEWVLDALPQRTAVATPPFELAIDFLKETVLGQEYQIHYRADDETVAAEVRRVPEQEALARFRFQSLG